MSTPLTLYAPARVKKCHATRPAAAAARLAKVLALCEALDVALCDALDHDAAGYDELLAPPDGTPEDALAGACADEADLLREDLEWLLRSLRRAGIAGGMPPAVFERASRLRVVVRRTQAE